MSGLRREQLRIGLQVGLHEGGNGERLHGSIDKLDHAGAFVWIPDPRYSTALPRAVRGFLTKLSYEQAEAGAMWAEPATACGPMPTGPTGADLIAFLAWAKATGAVAEHAATGYRNAARHVLAAQSDGDAMDVTADPVPVIARFTAARRSALAPATLAQYASGYRRARAIYLEHLAAGHRIEASLSGDVLAELKALARAWQRAADGEGGGEEHDAAAALADAVLALPSGPSDPDDRKNADTGDVERGDCGGTR